MDPRQRGRAPPEDEAAVGTPREQWELELRRSDPQMWYTYRSTGEW